MRAGAEGKEPTLPHNVIVLNGVTVMSPADVDRLVAAARLMEGLALHGQAVLNSLPPCAPSSTAERLAHLIGQIETLAGFVEEPALTAQGLRDVA